MLTDEDKKLWEAYTQTVTPLKKVKTNSRLKDFGKKLIKTFCFKRRDSKVHEETKKIVFKRKDLRPNINSS